MRMKNRIRVADVMQTLRRYTEVDAIITDPPYNQKVFYGDHFVDNQPYGVFHKWLKDWIKEAYTCLRPGGTIWIVMPDEWAAETALALKRANFLLRNWVKWYETFGPACQTKFGRTSRHCLYAIKPPLAEATFNADQVRVASARMKKYRDKRANKKGKVMDDVWKISRVCGTFSERIPGAPTQLPIELVRRMVVATTNEEDVVIDPFCGTGTVAVASWLLARSFYGGDASRQWVRVSRKRLKAVVQCWGDLVRSPKK